MDYSILTKEELVQKVNELEVLNRELLKEKAQETTLDFSWAGNLGHWYWNVKTNIITFNSVTINNLGYNHQEIGATNEVSFFTERIHPDDYKRASACMREHLAGKADIYELEYRIRTKDGSYKWCHDRGKITQYNDHGEPILVVGIVFDITEKKQEELNIKASNKVLLERTLTDELTDLKNRRGIIEYLTLGMKLSNETPLSIAIFDIDDFSEVNDRMGHIIGDKVLVQVGKIMTEIVRKTDMVGRYGGEEFLIIYPETKLEEAMEISERIRKAIEEYYFANIWQLTISSGVYEYQGELLEEFIHKADQNLYKAKSQGKNRIWA